MAIWLKNVTPEDVNRRAEGTASDYLGMKCTEVGPDFIRGTMTVDHRTVQPRRILNGGISVTMAESLCSAAANFCVDSTRFVCVGLEINANHLRVAPEGKIVTATARPVHIGQTTQVWETKLEVDGKLTCICRMTISVLNLEQIKQRLKV